MRDILDKIYSIQTESEPSGPQIGDEFGISFSDDLEINTTVVEILEDGIVIDLDETAISHLEENGTRFFEGELLESEAQKGLDGKRCWKGYKRMGTKMKGGKRVDNCVKVGESSFGMTDRERMMADLGRLLMDMGANMPMGKGVSDEQIQLSMDIGSLGDKIVHGQVKDINDIKKFAAGSRSSEKDLMAALQKALEDYKAGKRADLKTKDPDPEPEEENFELDRVKNLAGIGEAEYQGRKVSLGKPTRGDVKKFKVYVRNPKGNVVKVNFGDPNMKIKKSNPARRKSFRARHNCDNPGPRHKARYWSCRKW